jgi:hypothetical protein
MGGAAFSRPMDVESGVKTGYQTAECSVSGLRAPGLRSVTVDLQAGGPQPGDPVGCKSPFPGTKFFLRQLIAAASFLDPDCSTSHCRDNRGLTSCDPAFCTRRRQVDSNGACVQHCLAFGLPVAESIAGGGGRFKKMLTWS